MTVNSWNLVIKDSAINKSATESNPVVFSQNERKLPFEVRRELREEEFEPGIITMTQKYFAVLLQKEPDVAQKLLQKTFSQAITFKQKRIMWNIMVVLSQLPYEKMNPWASFMAMTATRLPYRDIQELGISCYENWENKEACCFLAGFEFAEQWLQEYADAVYRFVMEEGEEKRNVLYEKDFPWEMAGRKQNSASDSGGYSSRYSDERIENRSQYAFFVGSE